MIKWEYKPVSIRYQNKQHIYASSGIHIIIKKDQKLIDDFILTINHIPQISNYQILINDNSKNTEGNDGEVGINWGIGRIREIQDITMGNKIPGFDLFPIDSFPKGSIDKIQLLKISCLTISKFRGRKIHIEKNKKMEISEKIKIQGYPFNLTNSLIFTNYQTFGTIVGKYNDDDNVIYLTDIRYVENLNGGIVLQGYSKNEELLTGLVIGNLRKRNGDGDLIVILGISQIIKLLNLTNIPDSVLGVPSNDEKTLHVDETNIDKKPDSSHSILPLLITDSKGNNSWGTSIHYIQNILITNQHVIEPYSSNNQRAMCQIPLDKTNQIINLTKKDKIMIPIKKLDLAFIFINDKQNQEKLHSIPIIKGIGKNYKSGDDIYSSSFGLFYQTGTLPLYSQGKINCIYEISPQIGINTKLNGLIISSCNVWNGSSGGGLFTKKNDLLIGLICSNANVRIPKFNSNDFKLEKNTSFLFIIPIELIEYIYYIMILGYQDTNQLNEKLIKLWNLEPFHRDILIHSTKL